MVYKCSPPVPKFEEIYRVCGGNMFLMKEALNFWFAQHIMGKSIEWQNFPYIAQEKAKIAKAFYPQCHVCFQNKSKPRWNKDQLVSTMKMLIESQCGYLLYSDLCTSLNSSVVDSLIEHNILNLRPVGLCSYDLALPGEAVVTPESACGRIAMEDLLKN